METFRLKNIAILILLLLNAFLLLLLGYQQLQSHRSAAEAETQLRSLYESHHLALSSSADLRQEPLSQLALTRSSEAEESIAAYLLGLSIQRFDQGGGIILYSTGQGAIQFRTGGSFDGSGLSVPVADIDSFVKEFFDTFGYSGAVSQVADGSGSVSATQLVAGIPVSGCGVTLVFQSGILVEVTGSHVSLQDASTDASDSLTCITALVRFLDHRNASGIVCSRVEDIRCVYVLHSTTSSMRLLPVWQIETDTYDYFVDCATGTVSRG